MDVSEAMHKTANWVTFDMPVIEVAKLMKEHEIGPIPVGKYDRLIGMITDRDLVIRVMTEGRDPVTTRAEEVMTPNFVYCHTHQTVEDAIHLMDQKKIRRLPVLNEKKRLVGMLSLGDISHSVGRGLSGELLRAVTDRHS